jgi:hypothetical protein
MLTEACNNLATVVEETEVGTRRSKVLIEGTRLDLDDYKCINSALSSKTWEILIKNNGVRKVAYAISIWIA